MTQKSVTQIRGAAIAALASGALILSAAPAAVAGILAGNAAAFGGISGSVPFNDGAGLAGTVDYAVFTAADFNSNLGGLGYVPGSALVYTYQIETAGTVDVTALEVVLPGAASILGSFDIGDITPTAGAFVDPANSFPVPAAQWLFGPGLSMGTTSWGLAFSSPGLPIVGFYEVFGDGASALVAGIPTPRTVSVPEPSTIGLLPAVLLAVLAGRRRRLRGAALAGC